MECNPIHSRTTARRHMIVTGFYTYRRESKGLGDLKQSDLLMLATDPCVGV